MNEETQKEEFLASVRDLYRRIENRRKRSRRGESVSVLCAVCKQGGAQGVTLMNFVSNGEKEKRCQKHLM